MQNIISIRSPKTNQTYKLKWDKPVPPSDSDIDDFLNQVEGQAAVPVKPAITSPELEKYGWDTTLSRFGKGLGESLLDLGKQVIDPGYSATRQIHNIQLGRTIKDLQNKGLMEGGPQVNHPYLETAANFAGIPVDEIKAGNYAGAVGRAAPNLALLYGGVRAGTTRPPTYAQQVLKKVTSELGESHLPVGQRPQGPITNPSRLLPTRGEEGTRFYSGKYGIADAKSKYLSDTGQQNTIRDTPLTILPEELGNIVEVDPIIASTYGTSSPPTRLPRGVRPIDDPPITRSDRLLNAPPAPPRFIAGEGGVGEYGKNYKVGKAELPVERAVNIPRDTSPRKLTLINPRKSVLKKYTDEGWTVSNAFKEGKTSKFVIERLDDSEIPQPYSPVSSVTGQELRDVERIKSGLEAKRDPIKPVESVEPEIPRFSKSAILPVERIGTPELNVVTTTREAIAARRKARINNPVTSTIDKAIEIAPPNIKPTIQRAAPKIEEVVKKSKWNDTLLKQGYDKVGTSRSTVIKNLGPAGESISKLLHETRTEGNRLGGEYASQIRVIGRALKGESETRVVKALDGKLPTSRLTSTELNAYRNLRTITESLGEQAENSGIHLLTSAGESVPFRRMQGEYFPHQFPEGFWNKGDVVEKLVSQGITPERAKQIVQRSREYGERYISPQHQRELGHLTGYYEKLHVLEKYAYDMGQKIVQANKLGSKDIADADSVISRLISQTTDPIKAHTQISKILGRGPMYDSTSHRVAQAVTKAEVAMHLSQVAISTMNDLNLVGIRSNFKTLTKSLVKTLSDPHGSVDLSTRTGATKILRYEALKDVDAGNFFGKAYGIAPMEKFLRTVSSLSGRSIAQDLFTQLKKNPDNARAVKRLGSLIDEPIDSLLKQKSLTQAQIDFAGGRMAELTSGLPDALTLPSAFTGHPIANLAFLFKRFAFTSTKNIVEAAKTDPLKLPALVGTFLAMGELTGDIKAGIKGMVSGAIKGDVLKGISEENMKRHQYITTGNEIVDRAITNAMQSWLFGMLGETYEGASKGSRGLHKSSIVASDIGEGLDVAKAGLKGNFKPLGKGILRRLPFVGSGMAEGLYKPVEKVKAIR